MAKDQDILDEAKERYKFAVDGWSHIYSEASNDIKFVYDVDEGQWPDTIRKQRQTDGRPVLTINKLQKFVRQVRGDQMQNRARVKVIPVDDAADVKMAELYNGLIRQIEYLSSADIAYDTAYMNAVSCSVGFYRLVTQYSDENSFDQDIYIKRIINPLAVHYDPSATEFTFEDAQYCFIEDMIDKKLFEKTYPGVDMTNFDGMAKVFGDWLQDDKVRIAEYFYKEPVKKTIVEIQGGRIIELTPKITIEFLKSQGLIPVRDRTVNTHIVKWCKLNGAEIIDKSEWPGKYIPIIPVLGDEIVADGKRYYLSLIRGAKGPQQMYNYWATAATENVALTPKAPFIIDHRQIKGFEGEWEDANRTNRMYLRYNAIAGLQKPQRETQTAIPTAIMNMMQSTAYDIEDHLGRYEASKGEASNERSGKAIIARITQSDKGTFAFANNQTRGQIYCGRQLIDLIPKVYDTQRALRIMGENGEPGLAHVNVPTLDKQGNPTKVNDLSVGTYDLIATTGASFSSKREEMVRAMLESMQYAPQLANVIAPLVFKYSDFPGAEEIYGMLKGAADQQQAIQTQLQMRQNVGAQQ